MFVALELRYNFTLRDMVCALRESRSRCCYLPRFCCGSKFEQSPEFWFQLSKRRTTVNLPCSRPGTDSRVLMQDDLYVPVTFIYR